MQFVLTPHAYACTYVYMPGRKCIKILIVVIREHQDLLLTHFLLDTWPWKRHFPSSDLDFCMSEVTKLYWHISCLRPLGLLFFPHCCICLGHTLTYSFIQHWLKSQQLREELSLSILTEKRPSLWVPVCCCLSSSWQLSLPNIVLYMYYAYYLSVSLEYELCEGRTLVCFHCCFTQNKNNSGT